MIIIKFIKEFIKQVSNASMIENKAYHINSRNIRK